jgi:hypothetical protein
MENNEEMLANETDFAALMGLLKHFDLTEHVTLNIYTKYLHLFASKDFDSLRNMVNTFRIANDEDSTWVALCDMKRLPRDITTPSHNQGNIVQLIKVLGHVLSINSAQIRHPPNKDTESKKMYVIASRLNYLHCTSMLIHGTQNDCFGQNIGTYSKNVFFPAQVLYISVTSYHTYLSHIYDMQRQRCLLGLDPSGLYDVIKNILDCVSVTLIRVFLRDPTYPEDMSTDDRDSLHRRCEMCKSIVTKYQKQIAPSKPQAKAQSSSKQGSRTNLIRVCCVKFYVYLFIYLSIYLYAFLYMYGKAIFVSYISFAYYIY